LTTLHAAYDMNHHTEAGSAQAATLTPALVDRYAITGTAADCIDGLRRLVDLGVDKFVVSGPSRGSDRDAARTAHRRFNEEVLPALQEVTT
jgi:alkanesulfonate monooxygenase SsuD/methylene tetrahydromethanopterin reductase-like flavin-dependent oxidoreductase (luciferase family)